MSDGLDEAIAEAGLNLLRADTSLVVHDGAVPNGAVPPYVVVYTVVGWPKDGGSNRLDGLSTTVVARWYCHCVGGNAAAARAVGQRVRATLLNKRPAITGLSGGLIKQDSDPLPPTRDESTGTVVMDSLHIYKLEANT